MPALPFRSARIRTLQVLLVAMAVWVALLPAAPHAHAAPLWSTVPSPFECRSSHNGCVSHTGFNPHRSHWGMYANPRGNCTNYVAYRLIRNGVSQFTIPGQGNAEHWARHVRRTFGADKVNQTPAVGAIAWWRRGSGHVAYVEKVEGNKVWLSDSAWGAGSSRRIMTPGDHNWPDAFLHVKDAPPARPHTHIGGAVALGNQRQTVVAAITQAGRLFTRSTNMRGPGWGPFVRHGAHRNWAGASAAVGSDGRIRLLATARNGDLRMRVSTDRDRWHHGLVKMGRGWSTDEAPSIATGDGNAVAIAAVKADGRLFTRTSNMSSPGFSRWQRQGGKRNWVTANITIGDDGRPRLIAVNRRGEMSYRVGNRDGTWSRGMVPMGRHWTTDEQPSITTGRDNAVAIAGVRRSGRLVTRVANMNGPGWGPFTWHGSATNWATTTITFGADGAARVLATARNGRMKMRVSTLKGRWRAPMFGLGRHWRPSTQHTVAGNRFGRLTVVGVKWGGKLIFRRAIIGDRWYPPMRMGHGWNW